MSSFLNLIPNQKYFGLSIGISTLRGVETDYNGKILLTAEVPLQVNTFDQGILTNRTEFQKSLRQLLSTGHFSTPYVLVCIPEIYAFGREYSIPLIPQEDIHEAISLHVKDLFPFPEEEIYYDWRIIDQTDKEFHISVVAIPKKVLDPLIEVLLDTNLKPLGFEPGSSILSYLIPPHNNFIIADINRTVSYLTLIENSKTLFTTVVTLTQEDTPRSYLTNITQSINEIVNFYTRKGVIKNSANASTTVYLSGELASPEWEKATQSLLPFTTKILSIKNIPPSFNKAYAAAVTKISPLDNAATINLIPESLKQLHMTERSHAFIKALLIRTTIVFFLACIFSIAAFVAVQIKLQSLSKLIQSLTASSQPQKSEYVKLLLFSSNAKNIINLSPLRTTPARYIVAIEKSMPQTVSVSNLEYNDANQSFTATGTSKDRIGLLTFKNNLEKTDLFSKLTFPLGSLESSTDLNFVITFIVSKTSPHGK